MFALFAILIPLAIAIYLGRYLKKKKGKSTLISVLSGLGVWIVLMGFFMSIDTDKGSSESTSEGTDKSENASEGASNWSIENYSNEYGEKTGEKFAETKGEGNFSNTATENSDLIYEIGVDSKRVFFVLYEYSDDSPVKDDENYTFKMKDDSGNEIEFSSSNDRETGQISISSYTSDYPKIIEMFKSGLELSVSIKSEYQSTYRFKIDTKGFAETYKKI